MAYKLIKARGCKVDTPELVALLRAGALFHKCKSLERPAVNLDVSPGLRPGMIGFGLAVCC